MQTREMTPDIVERLAMRARSPQVAHAIRSGMLRKIADTDGTEYVRSDIYTREYGQVVTKVATPRPAVTAPAPKAERNEDLLAELRGKAEGEFNAFNVERYLQETERRVREIRQRMPAPAQKSEGPTLEELLAELKGER